jgi:hypothetical protein
MVTSGVLGRRVVSGLAVLAGLAAGCGGKLAGGASSGEASRGGGGEATGSASVLPPGVVDPGGSGPRYPGTGFRVHEWGTDTIVVGSDGTMQRGLHHEEEDLPDFVYDRRKRELGESSVDVKMETPVTYFYSDVPLAARVSVSFPKGVLSQWYPNVAAFYPPILSDKGDPALDPKFPFSTDECRQRYGSVVDGNLAWGDVEILPRGVAPSAAPEAPLARYTWSHARAVDANALRVGSQEERFLFYRGLGNFELPVKIANRAGEVTITDEHATDHVGATFVLNVGPSGAAFRAFPAGVAPGASLEATAPAATQPFDAYARDLAGALVTELDRVGLYHDESIAMVKTWARQWFLTPGLRVLYLSPRAWTDAQIPLTIAPVPEELVRVMMIRVEAITPEQEATDVQAYAGLDAPAGSPAHAAAVAHFESLGRFAEPRLRRAFDLAATKNVGAYQYLQSIAGARVSLRTGE